MARETGIENTTLEKNKALSLLERNYVFRHVFCPAYFTCKTESLRNGFVRQHNLSCVF